MANGFKLSDGSFFVTTDAPGGLYNVSQLRKIADLADQDAAIVKATEDQRLGLIIPEDKVENVTEELASVGLLLKHFQSGIHQPTACLGQLCPQHEQDALGLAHTVSEDIASLVSTSPLKIGINGCGTCCVPTHTLDLSIIGSSDGYRVSIAGKGSHFPEIASFLAEGVPAEEIVSRIHETIDHFIQESEEGESFQEMIERAGMGKLIEIFAPYSQDAASSDGDIFAPPSLETSEEELPVDETQQEPESSEVSDDDLADSGLGQEALDTSLSAEDGLSMGSPITAEDSSLNDDGLNDDGLNDDGLNDDGLNDGLNDDGLNDGSLDEDIPQIDKPFDEVELGLDDASLSDDLLSDDDGALDEESDDSLVEPDEFDMNITIDEDDVQQEFSASGDEELRDEDSLVNIPDESFGEEDLESDAPQEEPGEAPAPDEHQVLEQINASLDLDAGLEDSAFEQEQEERDEAIHDFEATDEDVLRSEDRAVELREEEEVSRNSVSKISFTPAGEPVLTFESGITLCIHANMLENLASMTVVVEQQELTIIDQGEDYCISVGSLEFTFPKNRAA